MRGRRRLPALEGFLLLALSAFAIAFLIEAGDWGATAALFPRLIAGTSLALLASAIAFQIFEGAKAGAKRSEPAAAPPPDAVAWPLALAVQLVYVALIAIVGFSVASLIYLIGAPLQMRYRRWGILIAYGFLLTAAVVGAFTYLFHVQLPDGVLWSYLKGN